MAQSTNPTNGILAAVAAPFFMAVGFIIWDVTWKKSNGSAFALNLFKCNLASIGFLIMSFILGFSKEDEDDNLISTTEIGFLVLSGFIGIVIGDLAWLESLRLLGATRVLVVDTIKPFAAALGGWLILGESIHAASLSGIALTVVGVFIVSFEKERRDGEESPTSTAVPIDDCLEEEGEGKGSESQNERQDYELETSEDFVKTDETKREEIFVHHDSVWSNFCFGIASEGSFKRGYALSIINVLLDTYGSLLTKQWGGEMTTWTINLIRFGSSGVFMLVLSIAFHLFHYIKYSSSWLTKVKDDAPKPSMWYQLPHMCIKSWAVISLGVLFVTFITPALSNYALFEIALALAITLGSTTPMFALILEAIFQKRKMPSLRAVVGTMLAVGGVVILSLFAT